MGNRTSFTASVCIYVSNYRYYNIFNKLKLYKMKKDVRLKKQTRKVGVAGSFINQMMGNNSSEPVVGEGATILMYSDRVAYEVTEVSDDGMQCVIRQMDAKNIGSGYGDERYTYESNIKNHTMTLEWSNKKQCWSSVGYSVEIIKSLRGKYDKEFGYGSTKYLLADYGIESYQHLYENPNDEDGNYYNQMMIISGITKRYKNFDKISVIFGIMEEYRDPSF